MAKRVSDGTILGRLLLAVLVCLVIRPPAVLGQNASGGNSGDTPPLACKQIGYACSIGRMTPRSFQLASGYARKIYRSVKRDSSPKNIHRQARWLKKQTGVTRVISDGRGVYFVTENSIPFFVFPDGNPRTRGVGNGNPPSPDPNQKVTISDLRKIPVDVVGEWRRNNLPTSQKQQDKKALLLAPYFFDFKPHDETPAIAKLLKKHRNYEKGVNLHRRVSSSASFPLDYYKNWEEYDVIHLSTHGLSICENGRKNCRTEVSTGHHLTFSKPEIRNIRKHGDYRKFRSFYGFGFAYRGETNNGEYKFEVVLLPDFFKTFYRRNQLRNKLVVFSACEILAKDNMYNALDYAFKNSDFLAWTYTVQSSDARKASLELYRRMMEKGLTARTAYRKIPDAVKFNRPSSEPPDWLTSKKSVTTDFKHHRIGGSKETNHVREIITLLDPVSKTRLKAGDPYPIHGQRGDGKGEEINLHLTVEGYTRKQIVDNRLGVSFDVNDRRIFFQRRLLPDRKNDGVSVAKMDDRRWRVKFTDVSIPDRNSTGKMNFRSTLHLPGNGRSIHDVEKLTTWKNQYSWTYRGKQTAVSNSGDKLIAYNKGGLVGMSIEDAKQMKKGEFKETFEKRMGTGRKKKIRSKSKQVISKMERARKIANGMWDVQLGWTYKHKTVPYLSVPKDLEKGLYLSFVNVSKRKEFAAVGNPISSVNPGPLKNTARLYYHEPTRSVRGTFSVFAVHKKTARKHHKRLNKRLEKLERRQDQLIKNEAPAPAREKVARKIEELREHIHAPHWKEYRKYGHYGGYLSGEFTTFYDPDRVREEFHTDMPGLEPRQKEQQSDYDSDFESDFEESN